MILAQYAHDRGRCRTFGVTRKDRAPVRPRRSIEGTAHREAVPDYRRRPRHVYWRYRRAADACREDTARSCLDDPRRRRRQRAREPADHDDVDGIAEFEAR